MWDSPQMQPLHKVDGVIAVLLQRWAFGGLPRSSRTVHIFTTRR